MTPLPMAVRAFHAPSPALIETRCHPEAKLLWTNPLCLEARNQVPPTDRELTNSSSGAAVTAYARSGQSPAHGLDEAPDPSPIDLVIAPEVVQHLDLGVTAAPSQWL